MYHFFYSSYPYQSPMFSPHNSPYDFVNYNSPFVFQDKTNYQHQTGFHG
jgi:hypothetical protein